MNINLNLNLILVLAIVAVISVPIAYALVESSIVINMLSGQTTSPFVIKDNVGTEVFTVKSTGDLDLQGNNLIMGSSGTVEWSVATTIRESAGSMRLGVGFGDTLNFDMNGIPEYQFTDAQADFLGNNLVNTLIDCSNNTCTNFPSGGGEVFTWTGNHSASGNSLTNLDILEFASVEQNIRDNGFGDLIFNVASTEAYLLKMGGITEFQFFGTGNGNQFALVEQNSITWNTDGHDITPSATDLTINVGTVNDRINLRTFDTDRFTINGQNAQISVPFDFNSNAITEASIDCNVNTCTNFPAGDAYIYGSLFDNISPNSNRFVFPSGQINNLGDESKMQMIVQKDGTVEKFFVKYVTNDLDMATTVIVRLNGVDTSVGVIIPTSSIAVHADEISSFTVVKGDLISINFVTTGGNGSGTNPLWSFEIEGL